VSRRCRLQCPKDLVCRLSRPVGPCPPTAVPTPCGGRITSDNVSYVRSGPDNSPGYSKTHISSLAPRVLHDEPSSRRQHGCLRPRCLPCPRTTPADWRASHSAAVHILGQRQAVRLQTPRKSRKGGSPPGSPREGYWYELTGQQREWTCRTPRFSGRARCEEKHDQARVALWWTIS
jgi:hypothetical protein